MKKKLSPEDRKQLKQQSRMGYILAFMFLVIAFAVLFLVLSVNGYKLTEFYAKIGIVGMLCLSILIAFLINRKQFEDLRHNDKVIEKHALSKKMTEKDFVPGSGNLGGTARRMRDFDMRYFVIHNVRYPVSKELYDRCKEGDTIEFHYTTKNRFLLKVDKP